MIRHAVPKDVPAIQQLLRSLPGVWQDSWREDVLEGALDSARDLAFVAQEDGLIVGFASAHDVGFRAYSSELAVSASHQRQGIGARLVRRIEAELVTRGCAVLIADVYPPAEPFYRELQWRPPEATLLGHRVQPAADESANDRMTGHPSHDESIASVRAITSFMASQLLWIEIQLVGIVIDHRTWSRTRSRAVECARSVLATRMTLLEGVRRLSTLLHQLDDPALEAVHRVPIARTDHLPVESVRELWTPPALRGD